MTKIHATFPSYCKHCSVLIPKCSKPQTKCTQKKTQKYANNPQKYAKTHKSKQFAISALFVLNNGHNSTQFLFWWAYQPKLSMHNTRNTGSKGSYYNLDLVIKVWSDWDSNLHACHNASIIAVWRYDMTWYDILAQVQWYNDMVWKSLFNFVLERSVLAGNGQNGPNVQ